MALEEILDIKIDAAKLQASELSLDYNDPLYRVLKDNKRAWDNGIMFPEVTTIAS